MSNRILSEELFSTANAIISNYYTSYTSGGGEMSSI